MLTFDERSPMLVMNEAVCLGGSRCPVQGMALVMRCKRNHWVWGTQAIGCGREKVGDPGSIKKMLGKKKTLGGQDRFED